MHSSTHIGPRPQSVPFSLVPSQRRCYPPPAPSDGCLPPTAAAATPSSARPRGCCYASGRRQQPARAQVRRSGTAVIQMYDRGVGMTAPWTPLRTRPLSFLTPRAPILFRIFFSRPVRPLPPPSSVLAALPRAPFHGLLLPASPSSSSKSPSTSPLPPCPSHPPPPRSTVAPALVIPPRRPSHGFPLFLLLALRLRRHCPAELRTHPRGSVTLQGHKGTVLQPLRARGQVWTGGVDCGRGRTGCECLFIYERSMALNPTSPPPTLPHLCEGVHSCSTRSRGSAAARQQLEDRRRLRRLGFRGAEAVVSEPGVPPAPRPWPRFWSWWPRWRASRGAL